MISAGAIGFYIVMPRDGGASSKSGNRSINPRRLRLLDRPPSRTMTDNDGKDPQFTRPQMPAPGAAHQEGTQSGAAGRYFHRRMYRSAHRNRHSEFAQSDGRQTRRHPQGQEAPDLPDQEEVIRMARSFPA